MNITKLNFKYLYPKISKALRECDFISLDLEFSGTYVSKDLVNTRFDSDELRFFKISQSAKRFMPMQLGLCAVKSNQDKVDFSPMNFYIYPFTNKYIEKQYLFDVGAINFLARNNFDFNKTFYEGLPYISLQDYSKMKKSEEKDKSSDAASKSDRSIPPEARIFMMTIYNDIKSFVKKVKSLDDPENIHEIDITYVRKLFIDYAIANINDAFKDYNVLFEVSLKEYNKLKKTLIFRLTSEERLKERVELLSREKQFTELKCWFEYQALCLGGVLSKYNNELIWKRLVRVFLENNLESKDEKIVSVLNQLLNDENSIKKLGELDECIRNPELSSSLSSTSKALDLAKVLITDYVSYNTLNEQSGPTNIIKLISDLKKPLVFHNGMLDLTHVMDKFVGEVPAKLPMFKKNVNALFPEIYDTKYIIENSNHLSTLFPQSSLETVYKSIKTSNLTTNFSYTINDDFKGYDLESDLTIEDSKSNSESGYFFNMKTHEAGYDALMTSYVFLFLYKGLFNTQMKALDYKLSIFKNKMLFSNLKTACDFEKNEAQGEESTRFDIFVLTNLPESIKNEEISNELQEQFKVSPSINRIYGHNKVLLVFTDSTNLEKFKKSFDEENVKLLKLSNYQIHVPVVSYEDYIQSIPHQI